MRITLSVIKADVGGYVGHSAVHPQLVETIKEFVGEEVKKGILIDADVLVCGDDTAIVMTHTHGVDSEIVHGIAWRAFEKATEVAKKLKLYGA
ncbi:MAG: fructose-1,6-bisphosphatase, partial [Hydrogenobacter thermophilus]|nr:fructose-1,6-bisphosphatase [Hydrogenobacter thermophilus]